MKARSLILIAVAFVLGPWIIYSAAKDHQNSKRLGAEGEVTTAQVVDRSVKSGSRGGNRYYLKVQFQTGAGQTVRKRVLVNKNEYLEDVVGSAVPLRDLPSAP